MFKSDAGRRVKARRRYAAIVDGTWEYSRPTSEVAQHIEALIAAGMTIATIATTAGVSRGTITNVRTGRTTQMFGEGAAAVLRIPMPAFRPVLLGNLPALGTQRRLRALLAIGYPMMRQQTICGIEDTVLHYIAFAGQKAPKGQRIKSPTQRGVTATTAAAVARMYDRCSHRPLPRDKFTQRARNQAAERGWYPPQAWDETTIDDPDATPYSWRTSLLDERPDDIAVAYVVSGGRRWSSLTRDADRLDVVRRLSALGLAPGGIASRVSTSTAVIRRYAGLLAADTEAAA